MILEKTAVEAAKHPKAVGSLQKALAHIGEENNSTVTLVNYGGQGLIFKLTSERYPFPLLIKIPFYPRHPSELIAEHGILKEARIAEALTRSGADVAPALIALDENGLYFVREYADGEELAQLLPRSNEQERDALLVKEFDLVKKLFPIFHENPRERYTIRDLKPKNMIYTSEKKLYMIDCGSCRPENQMVSRNKEKALQKFGCGKYLHWPLEQLLEDVSVCDRRVDYFAWGVMAYYTLFLQYPYANNMCDAEQAKTEYNRRYAAACGRIREACAQGRLSERLQENIICALNPNPNERKFLI